MSEAVRQIESVPVAAPVEEASASASGGGAREERWKRALGIGWWDVESPRLIPDWVEAGDHSLMLEPHEEKARARELHECLLDLRQARIGIDRQVGFYLNRFNGGPDDPMRVGERSMSSLARNWLGLSSSQASELGKLSRGLARHHHVCDAYELGEISRSHVRELLRVLEIPVFGVVRRCEIEAGWVELAKEMPVRSFRRLVSAFLKQSGEPSKAAEADRENAPRERLTLEATAWVLSFLETYGRELVGRVSGHEVSLTTALESLCAEYRGIVAEWSKRKPASRDESNAGPASDGDDACEEPDVPDLESIRRRGEACTSFGLSTDLRDPRPDPVEHLLEGLPTIDTPRKTLKLLVMLMQLRASLDWQTGRALAMAERMKLGRILGYRSLGACVEAILGRSSRWARRLVRLDAKVEGLPALREAYASGRIGAAKTFALLGIVTPETVSAWIDYALEVSLRRLERTIEASRALRAEDEEVWEELTGGRPLTDELLEKLKILPGGFKRVDWPALVELVENVRTDSGRDSGPCHGPSRRIMVLWATAEQVAFIRQSLEIVREELEWRRRTRSDDQAPPVPISMDDCLIELVHHFASEHLTAARRLQRPKPVQDRQQWTCLVPGCPSRELHDHHLRYKSRGGGDELWNRGAACPPHHQVGEHRGYIKIRGRAPDDVTVEAAWLLWKNDRIVEVLDDGPLPL